MVPYAFRSHFRYSAEYHTVSCGRPVYELLLSQKDGKERRTSVVNGLMRRSGGSRKGFVGIGRSPLAPTITA